MKITVKFDPTFGQLVKTIKIKVSNLIYRWFKKPLKDYIEKHLKEKRVKKLHEEFERKFKMTPAKVVSVMKRSDASARLLFKPTTKMTHAEHKAFLHEELRKSAVSLNEMKPFIKASIFYDPEISDIHNESKGPTLKELIHKDLAESSAIMQQQRVKHGTIKIVEESKINRYTPHQTTDIAIIKKADIEQSMTRLSRLKDTLTSPESRKILE
jgi:hypothetical protein